MYFRGGPLLKASEGWNEHVRANVQQATILGTYLNEIGEPKCAPYSRYQSLGH